ncbi:MAG TPA: thermonuclease family protein [Dongiaceae bacterium]|jgi:endonuclease YncB( thermonuclease family)|nr:thermonuclease family protein [Dongiaceae bacterium]
MKAIRYPLIWMLGLICGLGIDKALVMTETALAKTEGWRIERILDGDTFIAHFAILPPDLTSLAIRVRGVDAPERGDKARCAAERAMAEQATAFTARFLARGRLTLDNLRWDKYGGRIDADVRVDGRLLSRGLIEHGLARPYGGHARRPNWC